MRLKPKSQKSPLHNGKYLENLQSLPRECALSLGHCLNTSLAKIFYSCEVWASVKDGYFTGMREGDGCATSKADSLQVPGSTVDPLNRQAQGLHRACACLHALWSICMCLFARVCLAACMHFCARVHAYIYFCAWVSCACMHILLCLCAGMHISMHACTSVPFCESILHICMLLCVHTCSFV